MPDRCDSGDSRTFRSFARCSGYHVENADDVSSPPHPVSILSGGWDAGASSGDAVKPGDVRRIGPWKIRVLPATHDRLFGKVPFDRPPSRRPVRRSAYSSNSCRNSAVLGHRNARPIGFAENRWRFSSKSTANAFTSIPVEHLRNCRRTSGVGSRDPRHGVARFQGTIACRVRAFAAALRSAESPGQFFLTVEPRISIWATHGFPAGATRLRASESQQLNPVRLFSTMDTAERSKAQIPRPDQVNPKDPWNWKRNSRKSTKYEERTTVYTE